MKPNHCEHEFIETDIYHPYSGPLAENIDPPYPLLPYPSADGEKRFICKKCHKVKEENGQKG